MSGEQLPVTMSLADFAAWATKQRRVRRLRPVLAPCVA